MTETDLYNRIIAAEKRLREVRFNPAPTVPSYGLSFSSPPPPGPALHLFVTNERPVYISPDGTSWSAPGETIFNGADGVIWAESLGLFVASCRDAGIQTSPDGITWTQRAVPDSFRCSFLATNGTVIVCTGRNNSNTTRVMYSTDAINWTLATDPHFSGYGQIVDWSGSRFMMAGDNYITSPDGIAWTQVHDFSGGPYGTGIVWADALGWVTGGFADGSNHVIATSPDGITWTSRSTPFDNGFVQMIDWNGSLLVAVGYDSAQNHSIMTSSDGVTWTARTTPADRPGYAFGPAVIWDSNLSLWFVALNGQNNSVGGGSGFYNIVTSPNGVSWTIVYNTNNIPDYFAFGTPPTPSGPFMVRVSKSYQYSYLERQIGDAGATFSFEADIYIPTSTFNALGTSHYTSTLLKCGPFDNLTIRDSVNADGIGVGTNHNYVKTLGANLNSLPAVPYNFTPDTWHTVKIWVDGPNTARHVIWSIDGTVLFDYTVNWLVLVGGPQPNWADVFDDNPIAFNEIYYVKRFDFEYLTVVGGGSSFNPDFTNPNLLSNFSQYPGDVDHVDHFYLDTGGPPPTGNPTTDISGASGSYNDNNNSVTPTGSGSDYNILGNGIFYRWTAPSNGLVTVRTDSVGSASPPDIGDTVLYVLPNNTTTSPNSSAIAFNDDNHGPIGYSGSAYYSLTTFTAVAGTTYYFFVKGYDTSTKGTFKISWTY